MNEREFANKKVLPKLLKLGFEESQISPYNTTVIYFGTSRRRADYVCYLGMETEPYLVVEVKKREDEFNFHQVESYALILGAPFFVLTNGDTWKWYLTQKGQGCSIEINSLPMPKELQMSEDTSQDSLKTIIEFTEEVFQKKPEWFFDGLKWHMNALDFIDTILNRLDTLRKGELINFLESDELMNSRRNLGQIRNELRIYHGVKRVKDSLFHILDNKIPLERRYDDLVMYNSEFHILGIGPTVVTRILAALHKDCCTIDSKVLRRLVRLGYIRPRSHSLSGTEYMGLMNRFEPLLQEKHFKKYGLELLHYLFWCWDDLQAAIR